MLLESLTESTVPETLEELAALVQTDCSNFFREFDLPLYRGAKGGSPALAKKSIRTDRKPTHTSKWASEAYDEALEPIAGFKPRTEALFTTVAKGRAERYGDVSLVFPIGNYKYVYLEGVSDLFVDIDWIIPGAGENAPKEVIVDKISKLGRTKGANKAAREAGPDAGIEIMIYDPNGYYAVGIDAACDKYGVTESELVSALFDGKNEPFEDDDY